MAKPPKPNEIVEVLLVARGFTYHIMGPRRPPGIHRTHHDHDRAKEKLCFTELRFPLSVGMLSTCFKAVKVTDLENNRFLLEWEGNSVNDMIADSLIAIIAQSEFSPASVKAARSTKSCSYSHSHSAKVKVEELHTDMPDIKVKDEVKDEDISAKVKVKEEPDIGQD
ncbi:hypothetical protein HDU97_008428 [Phlyctochytrium planicorne]|nr:hypothetical protein HDU97_008428 [Phlyctochytrium planicorne]